jgi:hypothetical protein
MDDSSTSLERSSGELIRFAIAALGVLLGICSIIFARPVMGVAGVVLLLLAVGLAARD